MYLIAGSYERYIWGYKLNRKTSSLAQLFSYPSHSSPITTVAAASSVAASGSSDDTIHLYSILPSSATSLSSLPLTSTVTALSFLNSPSLSFPTNLLSATADGSVSIFGNDPFVLLKSVKVHKRKVNDLAVHQSGKLALTVGQDECLAMVNLVRGRRSFCCRLSKEAGLVEFDQTGERFFMASEENVTVHQAEDAKLIQQFQCPKRVLCAAPGENGILFTGGEDRNITAWDTNSGQVAYCIENAHSSRVKGIVVLTGKDGLTDADPYSVASASSDGGIRVWDVRMVQKEKPSPLAEANTKSRLTCLSGSSLKCECHAYLICDLLSFYLCKASVQNAGSSLFLCF